MSGFEIERYDEAMAAEWDRFVESESSNGTILQSRRFLSYHPAGRFKDCSLVVRKGQSIVAVIPACELVDEGVKTFSSHPGSTYGGIVFDKRCQATAKAIDLVRLFDSWLAENGFGRTVLKQTPDFFCREESSVMEYALQHEGYETYGEISYVIDFQGFPEPVEAGFSTSRRRDCRYSARNKFEFRELVSEADIASFYAVLMKTLTKYETKPVHTYGELIDLKENRLEESVRFYGVFLEDRLVAGSMVFLFGRQVFHTQYLAADPDYLDLFPMNYLDWKLIATARDMGFPKFSFGISTEEHGRKVNLTLATFKEGFGCCHGINRTFSKAVQTPRCSFAN